MWRLPTVIVISCSEVGGATLMVGSLTVDLAALLAFQRPIFYFIVVVKAAIIHSFGSLVLNRRLIPIVSELINEVLHFWTLEKFAMPRPNRSVLSRSHHLTHDLVALIVEIVIGPV